MKIDVGFTVGDRVRIVNRTDYCNGIVGTIVRLGGLAAWNRRHHIKLEGGDLIYIMPDELERLSDTSSTSQSEKSNGQ